MFEAIDVIILSKTQHQLQVTQTEDNRRDGMEKWLDIRITSQSFSNGILVRIDPSFLQHPSIHSPQAPLIEVLPVRWNDLRRLSILILQIDEEHHFQL